MVFHSSAYVLDYEAPIRHTYGTHGAYAYGMGHHNNPLDPRNPMSPAFFYTFIDKGGNGGRRGGSPSGCGCWLFFLLAFAVGVAIAAVVNN